jgi:hypothetical protein
MLLIDDLSNSRQLRRLPHHLGHGFIFSTEHNDGLVWVWVYAFNRAQNALFPWGKYKSPRLKIIYF